MVEVGVLFRLVALMLFPSTVFPTRLSAERRDFSSTRGRFPSGSHLEKLRRRFVTELSGPIVMLTNMRMF